MAISIDDQRRAQWRDERVDRETAEALRPVAAARAGIKPAARGDWHTLRDRLNSSLAYMARITRPVAKFVVRESIRFTSANRTEITARWYCRGAERPGPAVVYAHGGGMIAGDVDLYDRVVSGYVAATGVPFLSVGYRLAPEASGGQPAEDLLHAILWLRDNAEEFEVDPAALAVMGDSGGAGVAASAAILARDRGVSLAGQILVYPMLDDRTVAGDELLDPFGIWTYDMNYTAWAARLGGEPGSSGVEASAAPARLDDFAGLAPAYLEVGDIDTFCGETLSYAQNLQRANVPVELLVVSGAVHGFDRFAPFSRLTERALASRHRLIRSLVCDSEDAGLGW